MSEERPFPGEPEIRGDDEMEEFPDYFLPSYLGATTFQKLPYCPDDGSLVKARPEVAIVGAPLDDGTSNRPGARFGPRAIRQATYHSGDLWSIQLETEVLSKVRAVDAGDAPIVPSRLERAHRVIREKVKGVASAGAIPIVLGGDHSVTYPSVAAVSEIQGPRKVGVVHFDAHADTGIEVWGSLLSHGTPMRKLITEGWVEGRNFVQVGLRGYWPERDTFEWMQEQGMRWHRMVEIEERGAEDVIDRAIGEALDGPDCIYLSIDIDVADPSAAPGTGTPEPGGMLARELLRAVRRIVSRVTLVGMDVVEVSPPYDHAELTATLAHRCVLETLSALAAKRAEEEA
ncbi:MAG TPA: agmatinase [Actinomycetota bacterium]|nr:agmatinase [Actinomycetota bacterium]